MIPTSIGAQVAALVRCLKPRRKRQLMLALLLMVMGALAETVTIGAVLPFLGLLASPGSAAHYPRLVAVLDWFGWSDGRPLILGAAVLLLCATFIAAAIRLLLAWVSQDFVFKVGHEIGTEAFSRALRRPFADHLQRNSSDLLASIENVYTITFSIMLPLMQGIAAVVIALCVAAVLFVIDPWTATVAILSSALVYLAVSVAARRRLARNAATMAGTLRARYRVVQEGIGGFREVVLYHKQKVFEDEFLRLDARYRRNQAVNIFIAGAPRHVIEAFAIALIVMLTVTLSGRPSGLIGAIPVLGTLALGAQRLLPLLQQAYAGWSQLIGNRAALADALALIAAPVSAAPPDTGDRTKRQIHQGIRFVGVTFGYPDRDPVLTGVDWWIARGARIGIVGRTGCGKSTLVDLLVGLLDPVSGRIEIDGVPLDDASRRAWQTGIAYASQNVFLMDASIAANIAFGEQEIDLSRLHAAAGMAACDFIDALPRKFDTMVGERGVNLSAGQRQRIGIARALYRQAGLLVLDESTSALDDQTERTVIGAIMAQARDVTIIVIAHRASALTGCDQIVEMIDGKLVPKNASGCGTIGSYEPAVTDAVRG